MELIFEPQPGKSFMIEVWYYDTILEIKKKIQKYQGIPVSMQTLIFEGQTLPDDADIEKCVLLDQSHVQLRIAADFFKSLPVKMEEFSSVSSTVKLHVNVKIPSSEIRTLEMDANDTVLNLKERILEIVAVPMNNRLVVCLSGKELHDKQMLRDCEIYEYSEIDVSLRPLPVPPVPVMKSNGNNNGGGGGGGGGGSKKLRVMVLTKCGKKKIPMKVNPSESVGELRKELQKLNQRNQLSLPSEGYFFIYRQNVMDDDKSFRWHQVAQGDTIEIFGGSVTGGGS